MPSKLICSNNCWSTAILRVLVSTSTKRRQIFATFPMPLTGGCYLDKETDASKQKPDHFSCTVGAAWINRMRKVPVEPL